MWKHNVFRASIFHLLFYICLFFKWWYHGATIPAWGQICQRTGSVQRKVTACDFFMSRPLVIFLSESSLGDLFQFAADGQWPQEIRWAAVPPLVPVSLLVLSLFSSLQPPHLFRDALILLPQLMFVANAETSPILYTVVIKGSVKMHSRLQQKSRTHSSHYRKWVVT